MTSVPIRDLRNNTAAVLRRVQAGDEITITQNGVPVAELHPIRRALHRPMTKHDLLGLLDRRPADPTLRADIGALTDDTTDDLGPIQ